MLELRNLNAFYGESHVLWDITLKIREGARVVVLGRNGAGKTTLLKSIMNAGPRTEGDVLWNNESLGRLPHFRRVRAGLSLVPEDRRIFSHVTVTENLALALQAGSNVNAYTPDEMLERFPALKPLRERYGNQLSGGQQQLLAIARGLMTRPKLLLLDEPTEGVSPVLVQQMAQTVSSICAEEGVALLLSEQNLWFARECTNFIYVIDAGLVVFRGEWKDFDADPDIKSRYLAL